MDSHHLVAITEVTDFIIKCMVAVGTPRTTAEMVAEVLVTADHRGHFSHGLNRLGTIDSCNITYISQAIPASC